MRNLNACANWKVRSRREKHRVLAILCRAGVVYSIQKQCTIYEKCVKSAMPKEVL